MRAGAVIRSNMVYPVYMEQNYLDGITLLFTVHSLLHRNPSNIWIEIIRFAFLIKYLHMTKFLKLECNLDHESDNFTPCKRGYKYNHLKNKMFKETVFEIK